MITAKFQLDPVSIKGGNLRASREVAAAISPPGSPKKIKPASPRKSPVKAKIASPEKSPTKQQQPSLKDQIAAGSKVLRQLNNKKATSSRKLENMERDLMESSAGLSDRMSSFSDYAPSSNSGNSSSGAFDD